MQQILKHSRWNLDCFEEIAEGMAAWGHRCSATECCAKSKAMCLQYKKVLVHNNFSGAWCIECPYYTEFDNILKGDTSIMLLHIMQSHQLQCTPGPQVVRPSAAHTTTGHEPGGLPEHRCMAANRARGSDCRTMLQQGASAHSAPS